MNVRVEVLQVASKECTEAARSLSVYVLRS